ncbi:SdpA family antimicrobial peptide system protein [Curtobacterium sp. TC1]|uniref:SdpA family antimicrobial peptide system protein n=1 Tax=Curtobacterium sp. TC1 TaxID=2862880 RepID=UPI001C9BAE43|nr:SdpA family antimicrobial peptide system protein [Curtobacterium sp. TC1]QZQ55371.1 SdpA family antimicrobial peptide system protein [Curtobacterium sp. TC1]
MLNPEVRALALCVAVVAVTVSGVTALSLPTADHLGPASKRVANVAREVIPEGWSFFTKSPRESFVVAYDDEGNAVGTAPNSQGKWSFGLNRASRLGGIDVERVMRKLDPGDWRRCEEGMDVTVCGEGLEHQSVRVTNELNSLCGKITLAREEPVPWAFRGMDPLIEEIAVVEVRCR